MNSKLIQLYEQENYELDPSFVEHKYDLELARLSEVEKQLHGLIRSQVVNLASFLSRDIGDEQRKGTTIHSACDAHEYCVKVMHDVYGRMADSKKRDMERMKYRLSIIEKVLLLLLRLNKDKLAKYSLEELHTAKDILNDLQEPTH